MKSQETPADESTPQRHERFVEFGAAFIPMAQASKLMQLSQRALRPPTVDAQVTPLACCVWSALADCPASVGFRIAGPVALDP